MTEAFEPPPVAIWSGDDVDLEVWLVDLARDLDLLVARARDMGSLPNSGTEGDVAKVAAGIALRLVLARHVGIDRARLPFIIAPGGKPALAVDGPQFSLAHCDGAALIAISRDGPVGVDIEAPRAIRISPDRRLMLEAEAQSLDPARPLPVEPPDRRFLQAWVRLEALAKTTGEGVGSLLGRVGHATDPLAGTTIDGRAVVVRDLDLPAGTPFQAAVGGVGRRFAAIPSAAAFQLLDARHLLA
jgi:hypothetical protein